MYVTTIPNRTSPPAILIRESYRDGDKVKTRTIANITGWPKQRIEAYRKGTSCAFVDLCPIDDPGEQIESRQVGTGRVGGRGTGY